MSDSPYQVKDEELSPYPAALKIVKENITPSAKDWDVRSDRSSYQNEIKVTDLTFDEKYEIADHTILGEVSFE